ncbi:Gfo/Idh/MocA family protein [Jiangella asiatica]|uniref:Gfo/Idh/MocA family oxidoreductase n=1 Tax=Jiangella asiatica TaxID=2530372 RepID=A0A4R5DQ24_9ACTN|nr:Gfo/Idh/MocA family oxidoreductase [Jiangella asiatica]TDE14280.1 Gfo/Idh/MocA family oxidoreductase [Jiangella asiatica]
MLRVVHIGLGRWGSVWCRDVLPHLESAGLAKTVAAVDTDVSSHGRAPAGVPCYTDLRDALRDHAADFVTVVVQPAFHEAVIDVALEHDVHILCEKPIADTMEACARVYRKVTAAGRKMAVTMSHRFDQDKHSLEAAVRGGDYGRLNYVVYRFTHNSRHVGDWGEFRYRIPDPLLVEGTVHHFDIVRALTRADAVTVYARTWNPPWSEFAGDSTALITVEMTNGTKVLYEGAKANASTMNGWGNDYIRAECENGTLELSRRRLRVLHGGAHDVPTADELPLLDTRSVWRNAWIAEQFCAWLRGGPEPPTTLADNLQCAALLFAAIESAHTGEPVKVQDYLAAHLEATSSS